MSLGLAPLFIGTLPVFLPHVSSGLGWGAATFPQAALTAGVAGAVAGPFIGRLLDEYGVRRLMIGGLIMWAASLFAMSTLGGSRTQLLAYSIVMGVAAGACGPIAFAKVIAGWYDRHRGFAMAVVLSAAPAIMTAAFVLAADWLIGLYGWRSTYRLFAAVVVCVAVPVALLMLWEAPLQSTKPAGAPASPVSSGMSAGQTLRSPAFWVLMLLTALVCGVVNALVVHFLGWSAERGISAQTATFALSAYSLAGPLGPLLSGLVADRTKGPKVLALFYSLPFLGLLLLTVLGPLMTLPAMIVLGFGFSSATGLLPYLLTRYFGVRHASQVFGIGLGITTLAMGMGPVLLGMVRDARHAFLPASPTLLGMLAVAIVVALLLPQYSYGRTAKPPT
jgi:predicted MFS family arabinose efflux permease